MRSGRLVVFCAMAALLAAGCKLADPSNANTDTFTGTIQLGGSELKAFSVGSNGGEVTITLTQTSPDTGATLGLLYGQLASGSTTECLPVRSTANGRIALTNTILQGTYCLVVFDSGFLSRAESYTVTASHP